MKKYKVKEEEKNKRIDSYLAQYDTNISRMTAQRLIEQGKVLINGKTVKASYKVQAGDVILQEEEKAKEIELKAQEIPLEILYEDNDIIVVNKPKGMVVHPAVREFGGNFSKCHNGDL